MSADEIIQEAMKLSPEERVRVADALWESTRNNVALPAEQRGELDRRLAEHEANPDAVIA